MHGKFLKDRHDCQKSGGKMTTRLLESRKLTFVTVILLLMTIVFGYRTLQSVVNAQQLPSSSERVGDELQPVYDVAFILPENPELLQNELQPQAIMNNNAIQEIGLNILTTSDWAQVNKLANSGSIKAILIHSAALSLVDFSQLKESFERGLVVGGIGIPGYELAEMLGRPSLFTSTWSMDEGYTTPNYFYIFSYEISGKPEDIKALKERGWKIGEDPQNFDVYITSPLTVNSHATTDSLMQENGVSVLFKSVKAHIPAMTEPLDTNN